MMNSPKPATGKLGILTPGMGAVATTTYAGVLSARRGLAQPIGSLTQLGRLQMEGGEQPLVRKVVPIAPLENIVFGGWDIYDVDAFDAAVNANVLSAKDLLAIESDLRAIRPMSGVFDRTWVRNLEGNGNRKKCKTNWEYAQALIADIASFKEKNKLDRLVMVNVASTEVYRPLTAVHENVAAFEQGLKNNDESISPGQIYAYAAIKSRVPYANGTPSLCVDTPAHLELAMENRVPLGGKDLKTGQTLMKTILAPGFQRRLLGLRGWFSTNILGNRDGEVLDDPGSFRSKEISKSGVLATILDAEKYPELYGDYYHKVRINYYPPRGDDKEAWDNIDIFGWMGYGMQIKVNFLCKDSILAAPVVLDIALLLDAAQRADLRGFQEWMSYFFKAPTVKNGHVPVNDLFAQHDVLMKTLTAWAKV